MTIRVVLEFRTDEWSLERTEKLREKLYKALVEDSKENQTNYVVTNDLITRV